MKVKTFFFRLRRLLLTLTVLVLLLVSLLTLGVRFVALPWLASNPQQVATILSDQTGLPVTLDALSVSWDGWNPELIVHNLRVFNHEQQTAQIELPDVTMLVSWKSLFYRTLVLRLLRIEAPSLTIRRTADNQLYVGGFALNFQQPHVASEATLTDWLQRQQAVEINKGTVVWQDERRHAPPLTIVDFSFGSVQSLTGKYRLSFSGVLNTATPFPFEVVGERVEPANVREWHLSSHFKQADFKALSQWIDLPFDVESGVGSLQTRATLSKGQIVAFTSDVSLNDAAVRLYPDSSEADQQLPLLAIKKATGTLTGTRESFQDVLSDVPHVRYTLRSDNLTFVTQNGSVFPPTEMTLTMESDEEIASLNWLNAADSAQRIALRFQHLELKPLREVINCLPILKSRRSLLTASHVQGALEDGTVHYSRVAGAPRFNAQMNIKDLNVTAVDFFPGISGLNGHLTTDSDTGHFTFASLPDSRKPLLLTLPKVFVEPIAINTLNGMARWRRSNDADNDNAPLFVEFENIHLVNDDIDLTVNGNWRAGGSAGYLDLTGDIARAEARGAWRYIPLIVGDNVRDWLRASLEAGQAENGKLVLQGPLDTFPFEDGVHPVTGVFSVDAHVKNGLLRYQPDWAPIESLDAMLHFHNRTMTIAAKEATIAGAAIGATTVTIPVLNADHPHLLVKGNTHGDFSHYLRFLNESPVGSWLDHILTDAKGSGPATLALEIDIPLAEGDHTPVSVKGELQPQSANLAIPEVPPLTTITGTVSFTEKGVKAPHLKFVAFGGNGTASLTSNSSTLIFEGQGRADLSEVRQTYPLPILSKVNGMTDWRLKVSAARSQNNQPRPVNWTLDTSMAGLRLDLPAPLNQPAPLKVRRILSNQELIYLDYQVPGAPLSAIVQRERRGQEWQVARIAVEASAIPFTLPKDKRITVFGSLPSLDLQKWIDYLDSLEDSGDSNLAATLSEPLPVTINVTIGELRLMNETLHRTHIAARTSGSGSELCRSAPTACWRADIDGKEMAGTIEWENAAASGTQNGRLNAALSRLTLPERDPAPPNNANTTTIDGVMSWPQMALDIQQLYQGKRELGHVKLVAQPQDNEWQIRDLTLTNADGHVSLSGWWRSTAFGNTTSIDVSANIAHVREFLARFALPDGLVANNARLDGKLQWNSTPDDFEAESLSGNLSLEVGNGHFTKVEPGLGRLLGVLSLQALPRRIVLDFRDVFSEGFAFDDIIGETQIASGILTTDNFVLDGPAATVRINGQVNLVNETQQLNVNVRPSISEGLSVGAAGASMLMMSTPVTAAAIGLGTLVGQLILDDPIGKMMSYEYLIEGSWSDPIVQKKTPPAVTTRENDIYTP